MLTEQRITGLLIAFAGLPQQPIDVGIFETGHNKDPPTPISVQTRRQSHGRTIFLKKGGRQSQ